MDDTGSQPQQAPTTATRKKPACAECRQQKMRCEGDPSTSDPPACLRCQRLKIPCVFSAPFKRTHKRKRLQELEEETTALKRQLLSTSPAAPSTSAPRNALPQHQSEDTSLIDQFPLARTIHRSVPSTSNDPTLSRTIEGLELAPGIIDDCFELYFRDYHPLLPIVESSLTPNIFYQHAPLLFWLIVSIGCRRYTRQPTLLQALALPVTQLALQSILIRTKPIERMKGLILLLNWPFPSGPFYRDPCFLLSGTLLHMALQCGLHAPTSSRDFSKSYYEMPEQEPLRRAELWAYVVVSYQRTCSGSGQAHLYSFEIYNEQTNLKSLLAKLPSSSRIQVQISNIMSRAHKTLLDIGLLSMTPQQERTMDALLKGFNTELDSLDNLASSAWNRLYISLARQDLAAMHFYKSATTLDMPSSTLIFTTTSSVLTQMCALDQSTNLHLTCTRYLITTTIMSLAALVRVLRGPFSGYLDQSLGHNIVDSAIRFARSCSVAKGDYGERGAEFAEKLWKSKKVFRDPDGSVNITLRVRNRLSGGPLHDVIRCWKDEFYDLEDRHNASGMGDIETAMPSRATAGLDATLALGSVPSGGLSGSSAAPGYLLDDEFWGDLGLGLGADWDVAGSSMNWMA